MTKIDNTPPVIENQPINIPEFEGNYKTCTRDGCLRTFPLTSEYWHRNKSVACGFNYSCKMCYSVYYAKNKCRIAEKQKVHYTKNKCKIIEKEKAYYAKNKDTIVARQYKYRVKNKESFAARDAAYYAKNKDAIAVKKKEYCAKNKEIITAKYKVYYAKNKDVIITRSSEYYAENRDSISVRSKKYRADNKDILDVKRKKYYVENKDTIKARSNIYNANNKRAIRDKGKIYRAKNRDTIKVKKKVFSASFVKSTSVTALELSAYESITLTEDRLHIRVKCVYCGGWFMPTVSQISNRMCAIKGIICGYAENRLYCSEGCKESCPTFKRKLYPKGFKKATSREVDPVLRKMCFDRDDYQCQKCGATIKDAQLHCHHIEGYAQNIHLGNDITNTITYCKDCHKAVHKKPGCRYHELRNEEFECT